MVNRIDVDSDFGTLLNRFCSQVACDHPITLYGTGEQTRAFININDSIKCLTLAIEEGRKCSEPKINILNQMTATHKLNDLKDLLVSLYPEATYTYIDNPRQEKAGNSLNVKNDKFKKLGYEGIEINAEDIRELVEVCREHRHMFEKNKESIMPVSFWQKFTVEDHDTLEDSESVESL